MKKSDFIEKVAEKAELSKAAAARTVEAIFDSVEGVIIQGLREGGQVSLPGFGRFRSRVRAARKGRNPQTGQEIDIAERTVVQFSAGKGVSDALRSEQTGSGGRGAAGKSGGARKAAGAKSGSKTTGAGGAKSAGKSAGKNSASAGGTKSAAGAKAASKGAGSKTGVGGAAKGTGSKTGAKSAAKGGRQS